MLLYLLNTSADLRVVNQPHTAVVRATRRRTRDELVSRERFGHRRFTLRAGAWSLPAAPLEEIELRRREVRASPRVAAAVGAIRPGAVMREPRGGAS